MHGTVQGVTAKTLWFISRDTLNEIMEYFSEVVKLAANSCVVEHGGFPSIRTKKNTKIE